MPTYEYACTNPEGKHEFEVVQSFSDAPVTECPECGSPVRKVYGSVGVVFKGSGFYRTDSRKTASASEGVLVSRTVVVEGSSSSKESSSSATPAGRRRRAAAVQGRQLTTRRSAPRPQGTRRPQPEPIRRSRLPPAASLRDAALPPSPFPGAHRPAGGRGAARRARLVLALRPEPLPRRRTRPPRRRGGGGTDLPAGTVLTSGDLGVARLPPAAAPAGTVADPGQLVRAGPGRGVRAGEPITDARLVGPGLTALLPDGQVAAPVRLADLAVAALVRTGDRIDVLADRARTPPPRRWWPAARSCLRRAPGRADGRPRGRAAR